MPSAIEIEFGGQRFALDASGALWWPQRRLLVVSDLHLEKSTFLAQHGSPLAPYDSHDTLLRLEALIARYQPQELVTLGDSFHDRGAWGRLSGELKTTLQRLVEQVPYWHWIEGNHDVALGGHAFQFRTDYATENLLFTHDRAPEHAGFQLIGHYHPKLRTRIAGIRIAAPCFVVGERCLILPAFGTYTGGLDVQSRDFQTLWGDQPARFFMAYRQSVVPYKP
jgi:DNA ligase-associated metallophosphoesterase